MQVSANNEMDLSGYDNSWYEPGRSFPLRLLWLMVNALIMQNPLNPSSSLRVQCLRCFGAEVGNGVIIKPGVNVKYPWHLQIGDQVWIGENVWLDSLTAITIGSNVCISQGAYLCTGNHDWSDPHFGLIVKSITIENGVWIGTHATILPGVTLASHSVAAAGSVVSKNLGAYTIYAGNPAVAIKKRTIRNAE
jgi:putative colanic acid biosynthesis acetyltransferase WcaF